MIGVCVHYVVILLVYVTVHRAVRRDILYSKANQMHQCIKFILF